MLIGKKTSDNTRLKDITNISIYNSYIRPRIIQSCFSVLNELTQRFCSNKFKRTESLARLVFEQTSNEFIRCKKTLSNKFIKQSGKSLIRINGFTEL